MIENKDVNNSLDNGSVPLNKGKIKPTTFKKGHPGGPGRPAGGRNKLVMQLAALEEEMLGIDKVNQLRNKIFDIAMNGNNGTGDFAACKYLYERVMPIRKGAKVVFGFDCAVKTAKDISELSELIAIKTNDGEISTEEAIDLGKMIEQRLNVIRDVDIAEKIEKIVEKVDKL